jgi:hypothetical protein
MGDSFYETLRIVMFFLAAWLFYASMKKIDGLWANRTPLSDGEYLSHLAKNGGISEYDLFIRAAEVWNISRSRAEADFKDYLLHDRMPHYMTDFIRRHRMPASDSAVSDRKDAGDRS